MASVLDFRKSHIFILVKKWINKHPFRKINKRFDINYFRVLANLIFNYSETFYWAEEILFLLKTGFNVVALFRLIFNLRHVFINGIYRIMQALRSFKIR